jgi:hypothetical protein
MVLGDDKAKSSNDRFVIKKSVPKAFARSNFDEGVKYDLNQNIWKPENTDFAKRLEAIYKDEEDKNTAESTN